MSKKMLALVGVLVFLLSAAAVFGVLMWKHAHELTASPVMFTVNAEGWSAETSSPIPVHVTGQTLNEEKVDVKYFLGRSNSDLSLKPGKYEVEVYASPVNADGGMYKKTSGPVELVVSKNTDKKAQEPANSASASPSGDASPSASVPAGESDVFAGSVKLELSVAPANEITDEEIEAAQAAMKEAGLSESEMNTFVEAARNARQAELDRIKAEEEKREHFANIAATYGAVLDNPGAYTEDTTGLYTYTYRLLDINGDGFPELLLTGGYDSVYDLKVFTTADKGKKLVPLNPSGSGKNISYGVASAGGFRGSVCFYPAEGAFYNSSHSSGTGEGSVYKYVMNGNSLNEIHVKDFSLAVDSYESLLPGGCKDLEQDGGYRSISDRSALHQLTASN